MDYMADLMQLPAFQNLLAKIETNYYRNRPNEAQKMMDEGTLRTFLEERAAQAWQILSQARKSGMQMHEAMEEINDLVYPPLESDDE